MSVVTGFSGRSVPFHSLPASKIVSGAPTVEEALTLADLDWNVSLQPVYQTRCDGSVVQVQDRFLTVRDDTEQVLGNVGKNYRAFQNADAFAFADGLLGAGVEFDAAGHYNDSRKVFLTAKLPNGITVGENDAVDLYLLFQTSHDGTSAITAMVTPVRLACTNMLRLAGREAVSKWTTRHTASAKDRIDEAARTLNLVDAYTKDFNATAARLLKTEVTLEGFEKLVKEITPSERLQVGMVNTFQTSPTVDRTNAWGAINAVTEHLQWMRGGRGNVETRFDSTLDGQAQVITERATRLLVRR